MKFSSVLLTASAAACLLAAPAALAGESRYAAASSDARVGDEVKRVCFTSQIHRWRSVDGEDGVVLLDRAANDWYRLQITEGCSEKLIDNANALLIESTPGSACLTNNDAITIEQYGGQQLQCRIKKINKWNEDAPAPDAGDDA